MSFLKKFATVAKKNQKRWKRRKEGEFAETEMQNLFWPDAEKLRNTL